jgi:hypothetical protein
MKTLANREQQRERSPSNWDKAYRPISLILSLTFSLVGFAFLVMPGTIYNVFNALSRFLGMVEPTEQGVEFYRILAVAYMYVVSLLAFSMYRHPDNRQFLWLLINAKFASSALSFLFFAVLHHYLMYLSNGIVDGAIACGLLLLSTKTKGITT